MKPAPVREPTYSLEEAARELGVKLGTIRNWVWRKRIGSFRVGRIRIPISEIIRLKRKGWRPASLLLTITAIVLGSVLSLAACARAVATWSNPGATQEEFMRDRYACIQDARRPVSGAFISHGVGFARSGEVISRDIFDACMGARGYTQDPTGPFTPPPGAAIPVQNPPGRR